LSIADLDSQARGFAADVTSLLNRTVTDGMRITAVITPAGTTLVRRGLTKNNFRPQTVPLTVTGAAPRAWLRVAFVLTLDEQNAYLAVTKSDYSICLDEQGETVVAHYDYDRHPANVYPSAHVQVNGHSDGFHELCQRAAISPKTLGDFHFPVGGRRFRPTLEDVIEFLVIEGLVDARSGWADVVQEHRDIWETRQLRAAVRRNPTAAMNQLVEMGYEVQHPPAPSTQPRGRGR
jgi:hypothetical protein